MCVCMCVCDVRNLSEREKRLDNKSEIERKKNKERHEELWSIVKAIVWVVQNNWKLADKGIWEFRNKDQHFTFSKLLCWVAIDRAIKISDLIQGGVKGRKWISLRDEIKNNSNHKPN